MLPEKTDALKVFVAVVFSSKAESTPAPSDAMFDHRFHAE